jgi:hypothetical protein
VNSTDDPLWPDERVLEVVSRHVPTVCMVTGIDESGGEARVYFLDEDLVFKVQRPHRVRSWTSLIKEAVLLGAVREGTRLPQQLAEPHGSARTTV